MVKLTKGETDDLLDRLVALVGRNDWFDLPEEGADDLEPVIRIAVDERLIFKIGPRRWKLTGAGRTALSTKGGNDDRG